MFIEAIGSLWSDDTLFFIRKSVNFIRRKFHFSIHARKKYKQIKYVNFKKLLENKRVCLVGPAEYVDKEFVNHGKVIDSYDIVIRVNNFINMDESLFQNYGKRTDILITSLWYNPKTVYCQKESYTTENINKPLLIYYQNGRLTNLFISFFNMNNNLVVCEQPYKNLQELRDMRQSPTTGMVAIFECLKCNPKELYLTGITFGHDVKHKSYVDKYHKNFIPRRNMMDARGYSGAHNLVGELNLTKKLMRNNNIVVDSYLSKEIFHLDS